VFARFPEGIKGEHLPPRFRVAWPTYTPLAAYLVSAVTRNALTAPTRTAPVLAYNHDTCQWARGVSAHQPVYEGEVVGCGAREVPQMTEIVLRETAQHVDLSSNLFLWAEEPVPERVRAYVIPAPGLNASPVHICITARPAPSQGLCGVSWVCVCIQETSEV
jgi:hypothetical protein